MIPLKEKKMNRIYDININSMKKKDPELATRIEKTKIRNYVLIKSDTNGIYNILDKKNNKLIYNDKNPFEEAGKHVVAFNLSEASLAAFLGFGLGYEFLFYGNNLSAKLNTKKILIIEKNLEILKLAFEAHDFSSVILNDNVKFVSGLPKNILYKFFIDYFRDINTDKNNSINTIYNDYFYNIEKDYYIDVLNIFLKTNVLYLEKKYNKNIIYDKNIRLLKKRDPELAERIEKYENEDNYKVFYENNNYNIFCIKSNINYYSSNPNIDAKNIINSSDTNNARMAIFLGFGLGYEINYFIKNIAIKENTEYILIIEKEMEIFKKALEIFDFSNLISNKRITFLIGEKDKDLFPFFDKYFKENMKVFFLKAMKTFFNNSALKIDNKYYITCIKKLQEGSLYSISAYGNDPKDSLIGVENMLLNIKTIVNNPGIILLKDKFINKPAIVVSSGPSLNENIHLLKGLEDRAVIIAADSALRALLKNGIKPHFVTALERTKSILRLFQGFNEEDVKDVYLAACPVIDPVIYEEYPGPSVIVYRNFDHFKWLNIDKGILEIKQSSGNMSFKIAEYLGCSPIILIGQDLAYGADGMTHANGTNLEYDEDLQKRIKARGLMKVRGNVEKEVITSKMWYNFLKGYESDLAEYKGICINSTEGGAYIIGTEVIPLSQSIDKYVRETYNPLSIIKKHFFTKKEDYIEEYKNTKILIKNTIKDLQYMIDECKTGIELINNSNEFLGSYLDSDKSYQEANKDKVIELFSQIIEPKKKIVSKNRTFQMFLMHIIQSYNIKFEIDLNELPNKYDDHELVLAVTCIRMKEWYGVIWEIIDICLNTLNKSLEIIS